MFNGNLKIKVEKVEVKPEEKIEVKKIEEIKIPPPVILPKIPEPVEEPIARPMVEHSCCFILYPDNW
jgi:hypothetical protein